MPNPTTDYANLIAAEFCAGFTPDQRVDVLVRSGMVTLDGREFVLAQIRAAADEAVEEEQRKAWYEQDRD